MIKKAVKTVHRRGVTLIELLIVMAIIVLIAGVTLPNMRALMKDQKITTATRVVRAFIEGAKARAAASNREVAVIIERAGLDDNNPEGLVHSTRLSIGEVFPPYEGDIFGARGELQDRSGDGFFDQIQIPEGRALSLVATPPLASAGDEIELGDLKFRFKITGISSPSVGTVLVAFQNPPLFEDSDQGISIPSMEKMLPVAAGANVLNATNPQFPFRIYRKPSKSMSGTIILPRDTCIDLNASGIGNAYTFQFTPNSGVPTKRHIYIVFSPSGTVRRVFESQLNGSSWVETQPWMSRGLIHLLIGRSDQVLMSSVSDRDDAKPNLADLTTRWVTINPINGMVHSSPMHENTGLLDLAAARYFATRGLSGGAE